MQLNAKQFVRYMTGTVISLMMLFVSGCVKHTCAQYLQYPPTVPAIPLVELQKPINPIQRREYDLCIMRSHGLQVIRLGQTWKFIFPSDDLFINETAEINADYHPMLNVVADFMQTYPKIAVKVAGFSNHPVEEFKTKFGTITDQLTARQASAVAAYLVSRHINARLVYAVGRGNCCLVAWEGSADGRRLNRRVEVSFRYYRDSRAWY